MIRAALGDIGAIESFVVQGVATALSSFFTIGFFAVVLLIVVEWRMALIFFLVGPIFAVIIRIFSRLIKRASRRSRGKGAMSLCRGEPLERGARSGLQPAGSESKRFRAENEGAFKPRYWRRD